MIKYTKKQIQQRVLQNGKPLALSKFSWDGKTNTFSSEEENLVCDFSNINCVFAKAGHSSTLTAGDYSTLTACSHSTLTAGHSSTLTACDCSTLTAGYDSTLTAGSDSAIIRFGRLCLIESRENEIIKFCPYRIDGYLSKLEDEDKFYLNRDKSFGEHIIADGILSRVINRKGNALKVINHGEEKESYIVQDGDFFAHGETIKGARESLLYKKSDRDTTKYNDFTKDTIVTHEQAITMYMDITGACSSGTEYFCKNVLGEGKKDKYTVKELIEITRGQYNSGEFEKFFNKNK